MTRKLLVYPLLVFAIVSCSNSMGGSSERFPSDSIGSSPESYPPEYRDNFLSSCELNAESYMAVGEAEDYCQCVLENLEASMSLEEMLEAEQAMMAGENSNLNIETLAAACV